MSKLIMALLVLIFCLFVILIFCIIVFTLALLTFSKKSKKRDLLLKNQGSVY